MQLLLFLYVSVTMKTRVNFIVQTSSQGDFPAKVNETAPRRSNVDTFYSVYFKRALDIALVLLAFPVVLPVILILACAIMLDGHAPFFTQQRLGRYGSSFRLWKLRSMVPDADARMGAHLAQNPEAKAEWDLTQKLKVDPRITPFGHFLRKTSLDELPQLFNVLKGDMSLVGPRPMMVEQAQLYPGADYYRLRPGVTGLWQVSDRNNSTFAARATFDAEYADKMSLRYDATIMVQTVAVVLRCTGY